MESKLFVGNISFSTTEDGLRVMFEKAGGVKSAMIVKDRDTGRSRGFAFVEMNTAEDAQNAIRMFNGSQLDGRPITVNIARPREDRGGGGRGPRN